MLRLDKLKIPLEPIGYTKEEFKTMIRNGNPFILQVLKEGKKSLTKNQKTESKE